MLTQTQCSSVINDTAVHSVTTTEFQGEKLYLLYLPLWVYMRPLLDLFQPSVADSQDLWINLKYPALNIKMLD